MTCSPCYLAKADDCPRSLACLNLFEPNLVYETADLLLQRAGPATIVVPEERAEPSPLQTDLHSAEAAPEHRPLRIEAETTPATFEPAVTPRLDPIRISPPKSARRQKAGHRQPARENA
jgi:hypothetical protein